MEKEKDSFKRATEMIIKLQDKNASLRFGLGTLLKICIDTNMHNESEVWQQNIGIAKEMFEKTDVYTNNSGEGRVIDFKLPPTKEEMEQWIEKSAYLFTKDIGYQSTFISGCKQMLHHIENDLGVKITR